MMLRKNVQKLLAIAKFVSDFIYQFSNKYTNFNTFLVKNLIIKKGFYSLGNLRRNDLRMTYVLYVVRAITKSIIILGS